MKKIFLIIVLLTQINFAQSESLLLFDNGVTTPAFSPLDLTPFFYISPTATTTKNANNKVTQLNNMIASTTYDFVQADTALSPTWSADGFTFDGSNDRLTLADANAGSFDFGLNDFTVEMWAKIPTSQARYLMGKYNATNPRWYFGTDGNGYLLGRVRTTPDGIIVDVTSDPKTVLSDNGWHHLVWVIDRTDSLYLYVDGSKTQSIAWAGGAIDVTNADIVTIGSLASASSEINATIGVIRCYLDALTDAEVLQLYTYGRK